jgi:hypothetical protein
MKHARILLAIAILLVSFSLFNAAFGQPTQSTFTVKLNSFSLQVTYPAEVMPGDNFSVNVQATPTGNSVYLQSLTVTIYYADASGLHQLTIENLIVGNLSNAYSNYVSYGYYTGSFSKNFTVSVPYTAPRTSLVALFTETVQPNYYNYGGYAYNYPNYNGNPYTYQAYPYYPYYSYYYPAYSSYVAPAYYPYAYSASSVGADTAMAPLSYINANTPETMTLQSENQMLQQQLNQTRIANQQLQDRISEQNATISQLNQQLAGVNGTIQSYQILVIVLGVAAVIFLAFSLNQRSKVKPRQIVETKASI